MNLLLYENVGDTAVDNVCHFLCADFAVGIHPMFQNAYKTGSKKRKVICDLLHIGNAGIAAERFDEFQHGNFHSGFCFAEPLIVFGVQRFALLYYSNTITFIDA